VFAGVRRAIKTHRLVQPGEVVVVAVSGGADSIELLHCLLRLRVEWSLTLHVAHFDHGLRENSPQDALFVEELAGSWGLSATTGTWGGERRRGRSLQAEARSARYRFLEEVASHVGATKIALGHHRDDQAETVLLNLLRGSSLRGLRGMLALREGQFIRPLLEVGREDIEGYVKAHQLSFVEDPSNQNIRYLRNRIRWKLLPLLQREYNPAMARTLARMAAFVAEDEGYLEERAGKTFEDLAEFQGTRICMCLSSIRGLAPPIRRRILERAIRSVASGAHLTAAHVKAVERLAASGGQSVVTLPRGQKAWRSGGFLYLGWRDRERRSTVHGELRVPGEIVIQEWGVRVEAAILPRSAVDVPGSSPDRAYIDWQQVLPPLVVRSWRPGDRFRPFGLKGHKKLQDLFVDAKIPREERSRVPVVSDQRGVLWVPGFRIDERGRVGESTEQVLCLAIHRGDGPTPV
jgi:tRNA(Ile)-lysidine synthase